MEENQDKIEEVLDNPIEIEKEFDEGWKELKIESETIWEELTKRQEKFCQLYTTDREFFWNAVQAYLEVYDVDTNKKWWYKTACSLASRLTSNDKVLKRINELLDEQWLNDEFADKQLLFLLTQHTDFWTKLWAIREYNKLKQRITDKLEIDWNLKIENIEIL